MNAVSDMDTRERGVLYLCDLRVSIGPAVVVSSPAPPSPSVGHTNEGDEVYDVYIFLMPDSFVRSFIHAYEARHRFLHESTHESTRKGYTTDTVHSTLAQGSHDHDHDHPTRLTTSSGCTTTREHTTATETDVHVREQTERAREREDAPKCSVHRA